MMHGEGRKEKVMDGHGRLPPGAQEGAAQARRRWSGVLVCARTYDVARLGVCWCHRPVRSGPVTPRRTATPIASLASFSFDSSYKGCVVLYVPAHRMRTYGYPTTVHMWRRY
jgi:hypothetical protein